MSVEGDKGGGGLGKKMNSGLEREREEEEIKKKTFSAKLCSWVRSLKQKGWFWAGHVATVRKEKK